VAQRIREGIQSGQLTRGEVGRLRARIAAQRASGMAMRRSGATLSRAERLRIARGWREINRQIFRFRHNAMRRGR
jgi:hypothetical protein